MIATRLKGEQTIKQTSQEQKQKRREATEQQWKGCKDGWTDRGALISRLSKEFLDEKYFDFGSWCPN